MKISLLTKTKANFKTNSHCSKTKSNVIVTKTTPNALLPYQSSLSIG